MGTLHSSRKYNLLNTSTNYSGVGRLRSIYRRNSNIVVERDEVETPGDVLSITQLSYHGGIRAMVSEDEQANSNEQIVPRQNGVLKVETSTTTVSKTVSFLLNNGEIVKSAPQAPKTSLGNELQIPDPLDIIASEKEQGESSDISEGDRMHSENEGSKITMRPVSKGDQRTWIATVTDTNSNILFRDRAEKSSHSHSMDTFTTMTASVNNNILISPLSWKYHNVIFHDLPKLIFGTKTDLMNPVAVYVDNMSENIFVADNGNKQICVYNKGGRCLYSFHVNSHPWDVCSTPQGNIAVLLDDRLEVYTSWGSILDTLGLHGGGHKDFHDAHGIDIDSDGMIYVCDTDKHRVLVLDESGSVVHIFGPLTLYRPVSVAIDPKNGDIYVVHARDRQVNIYNHRRQYQGCIDKAQIPGVNDFAPRYVTFSKDGVLCISDHSNGCLHLVQDGVYLQRLGQPGASPGQFSFPRGASFTARGDLIVCDMYNNRVQVFARVII